MPATITPIADASTDTARTPARLAVRGETLVLPTGQTVEVARLSHHKHVTRLIRADDTGVSVPNDTLLVIAPSGVVCDWTVTAVDLDVEGGRGTYTTVYGTLGEALAAARCAEREGYVSAQVRSFGLDYFTTDGVRHHTSDDPC